LKIDNLLAAGKLIIIMGYKKFIYLLFSLERKEGKVQDGNKFNYELGITN